VGPWLSVEGVRAGVVGGHFEIAMVPAQRQHDSHGGITTMTADIERDPTGGVAQ